MTRSEAAVVLGVEETTPLKEIERRYKELYSEYHVRLTNAPTSTLKKRYAEQIRELEAAGECLLEDLPSRAGQDLPTDEPTYDPRQDRRKHERLLTPTMPGLGMDQTEPHERPRTPLWTPEFGGGSPAPVPATPGIHAPRTRKLALVGAGVLAAAIAIAIFLRSDGEVNASDPVSAADSSAFATRAESLAVVREAIGIARVELNRAAYTQAVNALVSATGQLTWLEQTAAPGDTAVSRLRQDVQTLRDSIFITCAADRAGRAAESQTVPGCPQP